ncbi:MAG: DUF2799 domain-containing protein [Pseudomonadota bacterium]
MRPASLIVVFAASSLGACAGMSAEQCQLADWETVGFEDGARGATGEHIAVHRKSCAKAGVTPDRHAYEAGRAQGLESYCVPAKGYQAGSGGERYNGVCRAHNETDFLRAFESGREHYKLRSEVDRLASRIEYEHRRSERLRDKIAGAERDLVEGDMDRDQRQALLDNLKEYSHDLGKSEQKLRQLQYELGAAELALESFEERSYAASLW